MAISVEDRRNANADPVGTITLLDVTVHTLPLDAIIERIKQFIVGGHKAVIAYANVHAVNLASASPGFRQFLNDADIVTCDGHGVRLGAWLLGLDVPPRYTLPDWIGNLSAMCVEHGFSMYLLGAKPGVAHQAASVLQTRFPSLRIAGTHHGYFEKTAGGVESEAVLRDIAATKPHILLLGFGMPAQETWIAENWDRLEIDVALTGGAFLDYVAGRIHRAPRFITDVGFEWLVRLIVEPRRLWRRYVIGNPLFLWRVLKARGRQRKRG
jgi:N-acetylglucosaminyldiphosphoundecaprenol N-acetyl-beta-D-mannosaminyltransferase